MVSENQKKASRKWDRENMRSLTCRLRTEEAEKFRQFCSENETTPGRYLKNIVLECIGEKPDQGKGKKTKKTK